MNELTIPENWRQHRFRAMGCQMSMWLEMDDYQMAEHLLREAEEVFHQAENVLSRFDSTSELSRLNNQTSRWTRVSDLLWSVITQALFMAEETTGLFDPTQLKALEEAGYDRSFAQMVAEVVRSENGPSLNRLGQWQTVELDAAAQAIWLPPNVRLDLGGIAKGYTAKRAADFLNSYGPCLVDASGDLTAGSAPLGWPGWPVAVDIPFQKESDPTEGLFSLWLVDGTMATSGIDYRRWRRNGRLAHHVIDPRTGQPAQTDLLTVTVLAKSAVRAEAWATAALVSGSATALQQLTATGLAGALVDQQNDVTLTPALEPFLAMTPQQ